MLYYRGLNVFVCVHHKIFLTVSDGVRMWGVESWKSSCIVFFCSLWRLNPKRGKKSDLLNVKYGQIVVKVLLIQVAVLWIPNRYENDFYVLRLKVNLICSKSGSEIAGIFAFSWVLILIQTIFEVDWCLFGCFSPKLK